MSSNLILKDKNVAKVVNVLKYVTLTFNGDTTITKKQIPGEIMEKEFLNIKYKEDDIDFKYYDILYSWLHGDVEAPIIVPSVDETYTPKWCSIKATNSEVMLSYNEYGYQTQSNSFCIYSPEPLYFKGETLDGAITRNVTVTSPMLLESDGRYKIPLTFNVNGVEVIPGTPKTFKVKLSIFKDRIYSKYLGYIEISVRITNSSGPGE